MESASPLHIVAFTMDHSPNSDLGVLAAERELAELPVRVERRPICVPRERGVRGGPLQFPPVDRSGQRCAGS